MPDKLILYVGINDIKSSSQKAMAESTFNLVTQIRQDSPWTSVGVSALLERSDNSDFAVKFNQVNTILKGFCSRNKIPFLGNSNIDRSHLNSLGLHLNKKGSLVLETNLAEFARSFSAWLDSPKLAIPPFHGFKLASLNIRGLIDYIDELRVLLADNPIDILALMETWLDTSISNNDVFISVYEMVRRDRYVRGAHGKMYGSVSFYVRSSINFSLRTDLSIDQLQNLCIKVRKPNSKPFLVTTWYRPPDSTVEKFIFFKRLLGKWIPKMSSFFCWAI